MKHVAGITITKHNVEAWPAFAKLLREGKVLADKQGRLRYLHGAPVGKMLLVGADSGGKPKYREAAEEWFDPESKRAREFVWPR